MTENNSPYAVTLDLSKEQAALNAAYVYLRARGSQLAALSKDELAEKINELHALPVHTETYTQTADQFVTAFFPPDERHRIRQLLADNRSFQVRSVLIERVPHDFDKKPEPAEETPDPGDVDD